MKTIQVEAAELVDVDIDTVSLVKHGANRCAFKILKADDAPTLRERIDGLIRLGKSEARVVAYFVRKDAFPTLEPVLKAQGIDTSSAETVDEAVIIKVAKGLRPLGHVQLSDALAIAIDQPVAEFSEEGVVKAYANELGLDGFAPGIHFAVQGLAQPVWTFLNANASGSKDERIEKVDAMLVSLRKYVSALANLLPAEVFAVEAAVHDHLTNEEATVRKSQLTEAMAGDIDPAILKSDATARPGRRSQTVTVEEFAKASEKTESEAEPVTKAEEPAVAAVVTGPTGAADAAAAVAVAPVTAAATGEPTIADVKAELGKAADVMKTLLSEFKTLSAALVKSGADHTALAERVEKLAGRVEETAAIAKTAQEDTVAQVHLHRAGDYDMALANLGVPRNGIRKSEAGVWDGLMSDLDSFVRTR